MPFQIIRNDITKVEADAIVNTANPQPVIGSGTDRAIYQAAGEELLLAERKKIGEIPVGKAEVTSAFNLPAKYIIHTVGPAWVDGMHGEEAALRSCYNESLKLAESLACESIAFPLLATGNYGFPKDLAIRTATSVIYDFLMDNDMMVYLIVFDKKAYDLSGKLFSDVQAYIDENYVSERRETEYDHYAEGISGEKRRRTNQYYGSSTAPSLSLSEQLENTGVSFSDYLMELLKEKDLKNSDVYHGANISKQTFSKIISSDSYHPTKNTICALAISLKLAPEEANKMLETAGMVLSKSSKFDIMINYFLENKMYNIVDDNMILFDYGLETLGMQEKDST